MSTLYINLPSPFYVGSLSRMEEFWQKKNQGYIVRVYCHTKIINRALDLEVLQVCSAEGRDNDPQLAANKALALCRVEVETAQAKHDDYHERLSKMAALRPDEPKSKPSPRAAFDTTLSLEDLL